MFYNRRLTGLHAEGDTQLVCDHFDAHGIRCDCWSPSNYIETYAFIEVSAFGVNFMLCVAICDDDLKL